MIQLEIPDTEAIIAANVRLSAGLSDMNPELDAAAQYLTDRIGENFQNSESLYAPLADSTIKRRESLVRRGASLVAGLRTPLRAFQDRIMKASTARTTGIAGSAYERTPNSVTVGVNEDDPTDGAWMRAVLLGNTKAKEPKERNAVELPETEQEKAQEAMENSLLKRLNGLI